jgi:hypothetical protein
MKLFYLHFIASNIIFLLFIMIHCVTIVTQCSSFSWSIFLTNNFSHFSQNFINFDFLRFFIVNFLMFFAKSTVFDVFWDFVRFWWHFWFLGHFQVFWVLRRFSRSCEPKNKKRRKWVAEAGFWPEIIRKTRQGGRILTFARYFLGYFPSIIIHKFYF